MRTAFCFMAPALLAAPAAGCVVAHHEEVKHRREEQAQAQSTPSQSPATPAT